MTQAFNLALLANKVNSSGLLDASTALTNAVPIANGGTGSTSLTANNVLLGNGTSALQTVAPGTSGNVLVSNGTTWVSGSASAPAVNVQTFNSTGTWTKPAGGQTMARIQMWGGGGGGGRGSAGQSGGGGGAYNEITLPLSYLAATVTATVGGAGAAAASNNTLGSAGGNTSFALATAWDGISTLFAYGGGGGGNSTNSCFGPGYGTGGGQLSAGITNSGDFTPGSPYEAGNVISSSALSPTSANAGVFWGGGSGGVGNPGRSSVWGGGGGGPTGGKSAHGGNGGSGAGGAGTAPGGGGGVSTTSNAIAGAGAAGRIVVTCW